MKNKYEIKPTLDHENCIVDALGRFKKIEQAENFIKTKMINQPNIVTWKTLLGAIRSYGTVQQAMRIGEIALKLDPNDSSIYILLGNIYSKFKLWNEQIKILELMKERGIKKTPGITSTPGEYGEELQHFYANNNSKHPRIKEILEKMKEINNRLIEHGYIPDTSWVNENISEEEKKTKLCYHSERFALAYALIITPPGKTNLSL